MRIEDIFVGWRCRKTLYERINVVQHNQRGGLPESMLSSITARVPL